MVELGMCCCFRWCWAGRIWWFLSRAQKMDLQLWIMQMEPGSPVSTKKDHQTQVTRKQTCTHKFNLLAKYSLLTRVPVSATFPEEQHKSVTLTATPECVCGCTECVCVTRCADNITENLCSQDTCNTGDEKSRDDAGKACGKEDDSTELIACEVWWKRERWDKPMWNW